MSVVTSVVLQCSCIDEDDSLNVYDFACGLPFRDGGHPVKTDLSMKADGCKHPQIALYCWGLNHFFEGDKKKLVELFQKIPWFKPDEAVLIITDVDRHTGAEVYRPKGEQ